MESILSILPAGIPIDLVKLDIEGGEESLLKGDLDWLRRVRSLIVEFHPDLIDYPLAIRTLQNAGFDYLAAGTVHKNSMDAFIKIKW